MTQVGLVPQNKLNWTSYVADCFCLLREFSKLVSICFDVNRLNSLLSTCPAHKYSLLQTLNGPACSLLQLACPELQFHCYSQINSSFWLFWAYLILPFHWVDTSLRRTNEKMCEFRVNEWITAKLWKSLELLRKYVWILVNWTFFQWVHYPAWIIF